MKLENDLLKIAKQAKIASVYLSNVSTDLKNKVLFEAAKGLKENTNLILKANKLDIALSKKAKQTEAFIERLYLNKQRIEKMSDDLRALTILTDPVGEINNMSKRPNGLMIGKMSVPLGVIGIIYESRPNVTSDCAGLCLKSGNAVILRGGKESINSNIAIYNVLSKSFILCGFPHGCINLIESTDRRAVENLLGLSEYIDLIIPRGGESLIRMVVEKSKIPVIKHYKGNCHIYVDEYADLSMAEKITFNAKVQRPATCNAIESLLVHKQIAAKFLPLVFKHLQKAGVEIRGCKETVKLYPGIKIVSEQDYATEYLDLILSVRIVKNLSQAIEHITLYGTKHSEAIITENFSNAMKFFKSVDAACVYLNASTRFTDGNEFGLGAEIGISTDKLHARGPMGLKELTTYKYVVIGNGQIRS
ncbi:MAG: glutamate-5-semialdehyde dehydrogenase [Candidatus Omnitrophota bacterium]|nr:MAG: glutamate-5-semialdehyde dehydrogenase [Candidatus Omnitrophota bacterium]